MFYNDIGDASKLSKDCSKALVSGDTINLILDKPRSLDVVRTTRMKSQVVFHARDHDSTTLIYIPYPIKKGDRAQAMVITYTKEEKQ